jgi:hypothetical protein
MPFLPTRWSICGISARAKVLVIHSSGGLGAKDPDLLCLGNGDIGKKSMKIIKIARSFPLKAQLDLAAQYFTSTFTQNPQPVDSPGQIGFWSEVARCRQNLLNTNLTGFPGVPRKPRRQGKKAALRAAKQSESRQQVKDWHDLLINLHRVIEGTAAEMISNRSRFGFFKGREQLKALLVEIAALNSRKIRRAERSGNYQIAWMENDGQIFYTGKGFNIPKPKE